MSYEILDSSIPALSMERHELKVNGVTMAVLTQIKGQPPSLAWAVYGPQYWPEAKELLLGLLELSVHADRLNQQPQRGEHHEKGKRRR